MGGRAMTGDHTSTLLAGGGTVTLNREGGGWTVDVWPADWHRGCQPVYHRWHAERADAEADVASWEPWPEAAV
jgi:hypothetical protein